jgi:DNA-binding transcriptional ArsR family regulator
MSPHGHGIPIDAGHIRGRCGAKRRKSQRIRPAAKNPSMGVEISRQFDNSGNMEMKHHHGPTPQGPTAAEAAEAFAALGSEIRLSILRALVRAGEAGMAVGALQQRLAIAASTLSHHLRALIQAGVLEQTRDGRTLICRARYDRIHGLAAFLVSECCADLAPEVKDKRA